MNSLIQSLNNSSPEMVFKSLVSLRKKYFRRNDLEGVKKFRESGGLKYLLAIIGKPNRKQVDVALSILGNCCLEKESREKLANTKAISSLATILKSLDYDSIQNRVCRTLANLAVDSDTAAIIHDEGAIPSIVRFLLSTKDSGSQQSAVRALRILANSSEHRENIITHDGIQAIASLLNSEVNALLLVVLRALAHLTRHCTPECAHQVETNDGITHLVTHAQNNDEAIQQTSMKILINLVRQSEIRPVIGNAGAISLFIKQIDRLLTESSEDLFNSVTALCLFCREAINRVRIRENGGLKTLIAVLSNLDHGKIHDEVIAALLNYLYDEKSLEILLELDLVNILVDKIAGYVRALSNDSEINFHEPQDPNRLIISIPTESPNFSADCSSILKKSANKRKESSDSDKSDLQKSLKTPRTYRINSPSYQQVQNEISELGVECSSGLLDDNGQWSPTITIYSPVQSPPDWRLSQHFTSSSSTTSTSLQSSPGGFSPDWLPPDDRPQGARRASDDDWMLNMYSRSPSPGSASPVDSPPPQYACYSPVCDDLSDQEEPAPQDQTEWNKDLKDVDIETSNSCVSLPSDGPEEDVLEFVPNDPESDLQKRKLSDHLEAEIAFADPIYSLDKLNPGPNYVHHSLMILSRISQMEKPHFGLMSRIAIDTLLAIVTAKRNPLTRAARILTRLARNPLCFESLITLQFPQQISLKLADSMLQHSVSACRICAGSLNLRESILRTMEMQTESPFGIGTITRLLSVGNQAEKESAAMMLPYLLRLKTWRRKTFLKYKGLEVLLDILGNPVNENFEMGINSLLKICYQMQSTLVTDDTELQSEEISQIVEIEMNCSYNGSGLGKNVCFILDNGEKVFGNRLILTESSEVFAAMLTGNFVEATQVEVKFVDTSKRGLEFIMHFLHGCNFCSVLKNQSYESLLDVATMADKLLLVKLKEYLHDRVIETLTSNNAAAIYEFAETHNYAAIKSSVLNCVLGPGFEPSEKKNFFHEIFRSSFNDSLAREMKRRIIEHLEFCPTYVPS